jgi:hypothetical protein
VAVFPFVNSMRLSVIPFKRPEDHIPRPRNAFILFRKHVVDAKLIPPEVEIRHQNISVVVSKMWAEVSSMSAHRPVNHRPNKIHYLCS